MTQEEFNAQWTLDELPACDEGMRLLKAWSDVDPRAVDYIPSAGAMDLDREDLDDSPEWRAYAAHVVACDDCDEGGSYVRPLRP